MISKSITTQYGRIFNDDLLINEGDLQYAKEQFAEVFYILDHPELRAKFREYEAVANKAHRWVQRLGLVAVVCGTVALLSAATEPVWHAVVYKKRWITICEFVGMFAALIAGMSLLLGPWRKRWLEARFMTERLRHWHFQLLIRKGAETEASFSGRNPNRRKVFEEQRRQWFSEFLQEHKGKLDSHVTLLANDPDDCSS